MTRFLRKHLAACEAYEPGEQKADLLVKLNTNESPYPPSTRVLTEITSAASRLMRYPSPTAEKARAAAARRFGTAPGNVFVGNGSDEILRLIFQAYLEPGDSVVCPVPTYTLYEVLLRFAQTEFIPVARADDFHVDIEKTAAAGGKVTVVATPNSPTGTVTPVDDLRALAERVPGVLLIDEAYADYSTTSALGLVNEFDNVIVARTLSKSYSLAGLRVGFAIASEGIIADLLRIKDSYNVSLLGDAGAAAALEDVGHFESNRDRILATRIRLEEELRLIGWNVLPSGANFIFAFPPANDGRKVYEFLRERGVLVRWFDYDPRISGGVRISVGTDEEIDKLLEVVRAYG